jgi:hypothetical protein
MLVRQASPEKWARRLQSRGRLPLTPACGTPSPRAAQKRIVQSGLKCGARGGVREQRTERRLSLKTLQQPSK